MLLVFKRNKTNTTLKEIYVDRKSPPRNVPNYQNTGWVVDGRRCESTTTADGRTNPKVRLLCLTRINESQLTDLTRQSFTLPPRAIPPSTGVSKSHPPFRGWIINSTASSSPAFFPVL